jgi:dTDP-4-amino-4,6-dideoxygalactose transaminase
MQHFQASMLLPQIDKLVKETEVRWANSVHLSTNLKEIPGLEPARLPENSRAAWYHYPMRYDPEQFNGLSREGFVRALRAEGVPCHGGPYREQYFDGSLDEAINSRGFRRLFSAKRLKEYRDSFEELKGNRQACATTVVFYQTLFLAKRSDMDHVVQAIRKIHTHSAALAKA